MKLISIVLSIIALIGSIYSYNRTNKAIAKLEDLDNAIFQLMKKDFNTTVVWKDEE